MKYRVEVTISAAKALKKIPKSDRKCISKKIDRFAKKLPNQDIRNGDEITFPSRRIDLGQVCSI